MSEVLANIDLFLEECCNCGIPFAMTTDFRNRRMEDGESFYCPAGHSQHYTRPKRLKNEIERLEKKLEYHRNREAHYREESQHRANQAKGYKGYATRLKNSVASGKCPCCNEVFEDLKNHMNKQHPNYITEEVK